MIRTMIWFCGAAGFVLGGLGVYPLLLVITFAAGDSVRVTVERCDRSTATPREGPAEVLDCFGSWQTPSGRAHGHVSGVREPDIGREVAARSGPLGPYAHPPWQYWQLYSPIPPLAWGTYLIMRNRRRARST